MSKHRVVVMKIVTRQVTVAEASERYGLSRRQLHRLLARYRDGGIDAVDPQSRRPKTNSRATPPASAERIIQLRAQLTADGLDAGPVTIAWHLEREGLHTPSHATIHRILTRAGLVIPEPRKRPRSSYARFEAAQPNETWQSHFTHGRLADAACTPHDPAEAAAPSNTSRPSSASDRRTAPRATRKPREKSNASTKPRNAGSPSNPPHTPSPNSKLNSTDSAPTTTTTAPHRALNGATPNQAYQATPKALPAASREGHYRLRYDHVGTNGKISLRRAARMHHLGIGIIHTGKRALALIDETTVTVIHLDTGEILSEHTIRPDRRYWRTELQPPGRWPPK